MQPFPHTIILRHRKENLKKCSLRGIEHRDDMLFFTYPWKEPQPSLENYVVLRPDAEELTRDDADKGIFIIDGTWRLAEKMLQSLEGTLSFRSIPNAKTAYPRCQKVQDGLASIEALYLAYSILGRDPKGLLDHYYWEDQFLQNSANI
ncbi:MAG: hypothetical protein KR126chlam3_01218 [Chlamydiae bacterium]|nr:hypothetical protein [Chlamydiota bacterium]